MTTKNYAIPLIGVLLLLVGGWLVFAQKANAPTGEVTARATYACDNGKYLEAAFHDGAPVAAREGEPPQPTGVVDLSLSGAPSLALGQTISADGARYATPDESLVFWNKGDEALILRDNQMDLSYTNCKDTRAK